MNGRKGKRARRARKRRRGKIRARKLAARREAASVARDTVEAFGTTTTITFHGGWVVVP